MNHFQSLVSEAPEPLNTFLREYGEEFRRAVGEYPGVDERALLWQVFGHLSKREEEMGHMADRVDVVAIARE